MEQEEKRIGRPPAAYLAGEVARFWRVSPKTVYKWKGKRWPFTKVGGAIRFPRGIIDKMRLEEGLLGAQ